ncbi:MAG: branched-chain amino acid ABC transporter permease [Betaproteobacteria bacterium]|nr:MAG: branched-chain amino acid ABC transporter permease [Betaproteobacteria bacterium]
MRPELFLRWAGFVLAIAVLAVPFIGSPSLADLTFRTCTLAIIAISWNMMAGAGLISLGHSGFWGVGSYVAILCANHFGIPFLPSLVFGMLGGAVIGAGLALITGRLRGIYFAVATLAMSEGLRVIAVMLPDLTGGAQGAYLNSALFPGALAVNIAASFGAVVTACLSWYIGRTRYHYAFRAMRANERASQMLGIHPMLYRVSIVIVSGAMASYAGAVSVWYGGYLDPGVAFNLHITLMAQIAPILGGIYTLTGPILGTLAAAGLGEVTRQWLGHVEGVSLLVFGVTLAICVLYLPKGIQGGVDRLFRSVAKAPPADDSTPTRTTR